MILTPLITTVLFALPNAAHYSAPQSAEPPTTWQLEIGQPAPPLGIDAKPVEGADDVAEFSDTIEKYKDQLPEDFDADKVAFIGNLGKSKSKGPSSLKGMTGKVVVVHFMHPESQDATFHTLPLLRDLKSANEDRDFDVISLLPEQEDIEAFQQTFQIDWALAEFQQNSASPYLLNKSSRGNYVWLISRSGFLAWQGDPKKSEKSFLKEATNLLNQVAAPSLGRPLDPALEKAVAAYRSGKWEAAHKAADKLIKKHAGKHQTENQIIFDDASHLSRLVSEHELEIANQAIKALAKQRTLTFLELKQAIDIGFPKSDVRKQMEQRLKEYNKRTISAGSLADGTRVFEALADRPALFPARKSTAGSRIEAELQKALKKTNNDIQPTQRANILLRKYAAAVSVKSG
jgi:hypothetical protein